MRLIDADSAIEVVHKWLEDMFCISSTTDEVTVFKRLRALPTVDAIPIEPLSEWLAGYAAPPRHAIDAVEGSAMIEGDRAKAWAYHLRDLVKSGLMEVDDGKAD